MARELSTDDIPEEFMKLDHIFMVVTHGYLKSINMPERAYYTEPGRGAELNVRVR